MSKVLTLTMNPALDLSTSIDKVVHTDKLRCTAAKTQPGGGGINVARVLNRLGMTMGDTCVAVYPVGGLNGQLLQQTLDQAGLQTRPVEISGDTRQAFSVHETTTGKDFRFLLPGPTLTESEWQLCLNTVLALTQAGDTVVASGSLPSGVPDNLFANLATALKTKGAHMVLDSSGTPLKLALETGVYLVKPSLRELEEFTGKSLQTEAQWRAAARAIVQSGQAQIVALSLGDAGALLVTPQHSYRAPAIPVEVVTSVGAGDNFVGGFIWAMQNGEPLERCLAYGLASASSALMNRNESVCEPEAMHRLVALARVVRED
jgi:6-phosphofructokinase 2